MNGYLGVVDVLECDVLGLALNLFVSLEIVKSRVREICSNRGNVFLGDGGNENRITEEELKIDAVCSRILGEKVPEGVQDRCAVEVCLVEGGE